MPQYSVIIPALNEEALIGRCVAAVRALRDGVEVIVADGGSDDRTVERAEAAGARAVRAPRGRGPQLNAGAAAASGAILIFLHADTALPPDAFALLDDWFADPGVRCAKFRLGFDTRDWLLDLAARMMWFDSVLSSYGDQGIVIRRALFESLGGFPDWPLFEDVRLFERARAAANVHVIPAQVTTSARRFLANGVLNQLAQDLWLMTQYMAGEPPERIAAQYRGRKARGSGQG